MISNAFKMDNQFPPKKEKDIKAAIQNAPGKHRRCVECGIPVQAYFSTSEAPYVREFYQPREGHDVHERNNRWAFYSALTRGIIEHINSVKLTNSATAIT